MVMQTQISSAERRNRHDRRSTHVRRFYDRRTSFDRRKRYPILGTIRDHPWLLVFVLVLINTLSWLDGVLTLFEVSTGIAREGNPLLAAAFEHQPMIAVLLKAAVILALSVMMWRMRTYRIMLVMSFLTLGVFAAVVAYHLGSLHGFGWI